MINCRTWIKSNPNAILTFKNLPENTLGKLYKYAKALVFPSFIEGFGWPPMEAAVRGCPVITTRTGAIADLLGNNAKYVEAGNQSSIDQSVQELLRSTESKRNTISLPTHEDCRSSISIFTNRFSLLDCLTILMLFFTAPLHWLRKTKAFQSLLKSRLNLPKLYDIGYIHQVALRPFTHASIRWKKQQLEPGISKLVKNIAKELDVQNDQGCFFDVGANVGLYTWEVNKICRSRKILAFEPDPENTKLVEKTLSGANLQVCP